ncbi:MAG: hypothetical protein KJP00_09115 [Bacteroidia bacterium]|nr:hypothetical protein [Bacteroidia bacterium]
MKFKTLLFVLASALIFIKCTPYYQAIDFADKTSDHQLIAVLPFEMVYTGIKPDKLTDADIKEIEMAESQAFQISFANAVLRSTKAGKKQIRISLQDYQTTNKLLKDNGIDVLSSWNESPEKLAEILNVDAVIKARIQKHRLMSDLESYGISVGIHIIQVLGGNVIWPWLPANVTKSKEINTDYRLINRADGKVLWSIFFDVDADWRQRSNEIIDNVNRRAARKFPYRIN